MQLSVRFGLESDMANSLTLDLTPDLKLHCMIPAVHLSNFVFAIQGGPDEPSRSITMSYFFHDK